MILTRLEIENFKQYSGDHELDVPGQATIGVIGENGTGKTTLFEAIEWCLYNPRTIRNDDVRPRGIGGTTTVRVYLESFDGSQRFVVERILKRTPTATIYQFDAQGDPEPIVNGARQVSDHVASQLIGLSHAAFTATFFTRQKELHLFEDETPMKRREQIGRMLGLETIRAAQLAIGLDRTAANAEARALHTQYERESLGRDLKAELSLAHEAIATAQAAHHQALAITGDATVQRGEAEKALTVAQERRDQHSAITTTRDRIIGEQRHQQERLGQIAAEFQRLDQVAAERIQHLAVAEKYPSLRDEHDRQQQTRQRFQLRQQTERELAEARQRYGENNRLVRDLVASIAPQPPVAGWVWTTDDDLEPIFGLDRLLAVARSAKPDIHEQVEKALHQCLELQKRVNAERHRLSQFHERRTNLEHQLANELATGDPREGLTALDRQREELVVARTRVDAEQTATQGERDRTTKLIGNIESQMFGDACPTCGRPFSESDATIVMESLREKESNLRTRIATLRAETASISTQAANLDTSRDLLLKQVAIVDDIRQRLDRSVSFIADQEQTVAASESELGAFLERLGRESVPTEPELAQAAAATREARDLANSARALLNHRNVAQSTTDHIATASTSLNDLGNVTFDPAAFDALTAELARADRARTSIVHIDQELARRPALQSEAQTLETARAETTIRQTEVERQLAALGYQEVELTTARATLGAAQQRERGALAASHQAELALQEARSRLESVEADERRLRELAALGDERKRDYDQLDLMVKEFAEFERFALGRKLPVLADITSQLVAAVTDGKYDRVEFDQDFGIVVGDGGVTDETFALDTFSGGERDAITLAARIALSHMIGRSATNPPGFLVLDEVFGSLDTDRRARLMDLLGSITSQFDELRQVFIISHVDDVRSSPVLDELWRIEETSDGTSRITALAAGTEIETL